jgi:polyphosphate kinase 2 (PPK2 family)
VYSFTQLSADELDHTFLWRASRALPERGRIDIFNRSYQEGVLVLRVHAEILDRQQLSLARLEASACGTSAPRTSTPSSVTSTGTAPRS